MSSKTFLKKRSNTKPSDEQSDDRRFDLAESTMAKGGYAGEAPAQETPAAPTADTKPTEPEQKAEKRKPASWSTSSEDREIMQKLRLHLLNCGIEVSKSDLLAVALRALNDLSMSEIEELAERHTNERYGSRL